MLKLEKISKSQEISVRLRDKDSLFNRTFLKALGFACLFHLLGVLIFQVKPFHSSITPWLFPRISVQTDPLPYALKDLSSTPENKHPVPYPFLLFKPSSPILNPLERQTAIERETPYAQNKPYATSFDSKEYQYDLKPANPKLLRSYHPVKLLLSGGLAEKILLISGWEEKTLFYDDHHSLHSHILKYSVQVDDRTGKVFWFSLHDSKKNAKFENRGKDLLLKMSFQPSLEIFFTTGEVELIFTEASHD